MPLKARLQKALFIVDDTTSLPPQAGRCEQLATLAFDALLKMTAEDFAALDTNLIISPPVNSGHDCLDIAGVLTAFSFTGCYLIVAPNLPDPKVVGQEISANFPDLSFNIVKNLHDILSPT